MKLTPSEETHAALRRLAAASIAEWSLKPDAHAAGCGPTDRVVLHAQFTQGSRKEGVSKEWFQFMFHLLASMRCWTQADVAHTPWELAVTYELAADSLETSDVNTLTHPGLKASIRCDHNGDAATLDVVCDKPDAAPATISLGKHGAVRVHALRNLGKRLYTKRETVPKTAVVEARKTFTFHEFVDWNYTFVLRYREPYHRTLDLMNDTHDKPLYYCDPPLCVFSISCNGVLSITDETYFADSLLCKIGDLIPHEWEKDIAAPPPPQQQQPPPLPPSHEQQPKNHITLS